ncbi:hypothetical protein [Poseidonibacter ostreae]|uniref:Uncharacterized protein n=1 Tax=Poseidonibacter ostreae TaxID=2654171 RepID=A0A6L4WTT7_9BACT|nr:hypothetical protein [Poseidonibacter ostreae]KAB7889560.1 hypothetical protein GBG19_05755 [Poseidonibacter ostreae]
MYKFKKNYKFPIIVKTKAYVKDSVVFAYHPFTEDYEFGEWKGAVQLAERAEEKYNKQLGEIVSISEYNMTEEGIEKFLTDVEFFLLK